MSVFRGSLSDRRLSWVEWLQGLGQGQVRQPLRFAAGAPPGKVLRTDLRPTYAYVFVADEDVAGFETTHGKQHGERTLKVERAKKK